MKTENEPLLNESTPTSTPTSPPISPPKKALPSTRQKVTLSLTDLANGKTKNRDESDKAETDKLQEPKKTQAFSLEELKNAWDEFAEQRKTQVGEYHLLRQAFHFKDNVVTIQLSNQVEEPLLQSIRTPLTEFLRSRLGNDMIHVVSEVQHVQSKKFAYTNKEKFDHLAEKHPILLELKERLGLDPDF